DLLPAVHANLQSGPLHGPTFCPHPRMGHLMAKQELFHRNFVFIGVKGGSCLVAGLLFVCKAEPRLR
ncbi:hypothetical protein, partial [Collinsella aerofaciens]